MISGLEKRFKRELSLRQLALIVVSKKIGKRIAIDHPEIEIDYRNGSTIREIIDDYHLLEDQSVHSYSMAVSSVKAILAYLIPREERQLLRRKHQEKSGKIQTLSIEKRRDLSRKGLSALGCEPFSEEENNYFFELIENPNYLYSSGSQKGRLNYRLISEALGNKYRTNRSPASLKQKAYRSRSVKK